MSREENGLGKLNYDLAADMTREVSKNYGVLNEEASIAMRGLFIIDPDGILRYSVVHDLSVGRSADETLRVLQGLQSGGLCPMDWHAGDDML